jgi:hypothetical protein
MAEPTILNTIAVSGFDPDGEPEIRLMSDGSLLVVFEFMPPSFADDDEEFDDFDKQLENAVGAIVAWEDREVFRIRVPAKDTAEKVRAFLENF